MFLAAGGTDAFVLVCQRSITAVPGWSTARNFLALRGQRDFITLWFLCDLYVRSWKVWNQTRDDSTYCWKTTQRVVSTFHPTRLYCFVFAPSLFVFIRHTGLSSMFILRWIQQWGILNSKLNPGEVQLYKRCWNQEPIWWNVYFINFFWSIQDVQFGAVVVVVVTFIEWCLLIFFAFFTYKWRPEKKVSRSHEGL